MKPVHCLTVLCMLAGGAPQLMAGQNKPTDWAQHQIIPLSDLNHRIMQEFTSGRLSDWIVECPAGTSLPCKIDVSGQYLAVESMGPLSVKVLKTCYVRCVGEGDFLFSDDTHNWKEFLDFFTGRLGVSVDADHSGPTASIQLELNQRK